MTTEKHDTISRIVRDDYRTADVFRKHGINYCCGGNSTLEEVCRLQNLDIISICKELSDATQTITIPASLRVDEWSIDFLVDYIRNVHHAYLKQALPTLETTLISFVNNHRSKFPFLDSLHQEFSSLSVLLTEHIAEEEEKIFPYMKQVSHTHKHKEIYGKLFVKTLSQPLTKVFQSKHTHISAQLVEIRNLSNQYRFPDNACTNHRVVFQKLRELDADIVQYRHLENNVLFPKAIILERELLQL